VIHELALERRVLHGHFSRDREPALTVAQIRSRFDAASG